MRFLLSLLLSPLAAFADPVSIRTGEHETFSRFVFAIGEGTRWEVGPTDGGFLLRLSGRSDGFDVSTIFDRIPKDRVSNVIQRSGETLFFAVECACSADAFLWRPDQLVIDFVDGAEAPPAPAVAMERGPIGQPEPAAEAPPLVLPDLLALRQGTIVFPRTEPPVAPVERQSPQTALSDAGSLAATEAALIEGMARAASQGFLDANLTPPPTLDGAAPEFEKVAVQIADPPTIAPHPGIGITTALDRDYAVLGEALNQALGRQCLSGDLFKIEDWGNATALHAQIADMAEALSGEFGEQPREAQEKLARLYLYFGFGAEAQAVLTADSAQSQDRSVLLQLAGLIDEYEGDYTLIAEQAGCETDGALWAFLAAPSLLEQDAQNQILQSFFSLPGSLRGLLAPRLSRQFTETGHIDAAERLLRAAQSAEDGAWHEVATARALIAETQGKPDEAIAVLSEQAEDNARMTPASVIRLIELGIENAAPIEESNLILAAAMRQEHRNTPIAARLALAEAAGRGQLGQYHEALELLHAREDDAAQATRDSIFKQMVEQSDAATFLGFAFDELPLGLAGETENLIAARLIETGFPERASDILSGSTRQEAAAERRYLRAAAFVGTGENAQAIDALLGITTPRANALRAQAYAGLGEYRAALSSSAVSSQDGLSDATLEFRAQAWERLAIDEDEVLATFAQSVLSQPAESPATSLADRRAILAQSQESRRAVEGLLLRFDGETSQD